MKFTEEQMKKLNEAKSAEELMALAKAEGIQATDAQIMMYYNSNCKEGELADDELDNVAGGGCHTSDGRLVTTIGNWCDYWRCPDCGGKRHEAPGERAHECDGCGNRNNYCGNCSYCSYEDGLWLCNCDANRE